jgi:broad specificity phosphatase PhoE
MRIFLIRHGQSGLRNQDWILTDLGIEQAKKVAKKIYFFNIGKCYVSDYKRAVQTFEEYHKLKDKVPFEVTKMLREIYHGVLVKSLEEDIDLVIAEEDRVRVDAFFDKIILDHPENGDDIAVFTHEHVIKYIISKVIGFGCEGLGKRLVVSVGSISVVEKKGEILRIKSFNGIEHQDSAIVNRFFNSDFSPDNES